MFVREREKEAERESGRVRGGERARGRERERERGMGRGRGRGRHRKDEERIDAKPLVEALDAFGQAVHGHDGLLHHVRVRRRLRSAIMSAKRAPYAPPKRNLRSYMKTKRDLRSYTNPNKRPQKALYEPKRDLIELFAGLGNAKSLTLIAATPPPAILVGFT